MSEKRKYDSTVARIAGNLLSGWPTIYETNHPMFEQDARHVAARAVAMARLIVEEVEAAQALDAVGQRDE